MAYFFISHRLHSLIFHNYQTIPIIFRHCKSQVCFPLYFRLMQFYSICTERLFLKILCKPGFYTSKNVDNVDNLVDNFILWAFLYFSVWISFSVIHVDSCIILWTGDFFVQSASGDLGGWHKIVCGRLIIWLCCLILIRSKKECDNICYVIRSRSSPELLLLNMLYTIEIRKYVLHR